MDGVQTHITLNQNNKGNDDDDDDDTSYYTAVSSDSVPFGMVEEPKGRGCRLIPTCETRWHCIAEDSSPNINCCENLI